ncbi:MAG TPA: DUF3422 domain-containing protein [Sphingobium sp.]
MDNRQDDVVTGHRFREHPLRQQVVGEMQLRRVPAFTLPAQIIQMVRLVDPADRDAEAAALAAMPGESRAWSRHGEGRMGEDVRIAWERHSEASTVTIVMTDSAALPIGWNHLGDTRHAGIIAWAESLPGAVIRAIRLIVVANEEEADDAVRQARFAPPQLVTCHVAGRARIWTDFRIHQDGYGHMVVAANGLLPGDLARCVQRLQELGNYRNLALLGLPEARAVWSRLDILETALDEAGQALSESQTRDDDMLASLSRLSAELLSIDSRSAYRMSATAAYGRIVASRLVELNVTPIAGHQSLADFTERRLFPAVRTCAALTDRLALLNRRAAQFTALLRARIETNIENQNARLLTSMDRSARMQLELQHLVEGLSVVAISYYLVGLLSYPLKAAEKHWPSLSSTVLLGFAVPLVAVAVYWMMQGAKKRLVSDDNHADPGA